jgi:hypothetical protein
VTLIIFNIAYSPENGGKHNKQETSLEFKVDNTSSQINEENNSDEGMKIECLPL